VNRGPWPASREELEETARIGCPTWVSREEMDPTPGCFL